MSSKARQILNLISMDGLIRLAVYLGVRWIGWRPVRWCSNEKFRDRMIDKVLVETKKRTLADRLHRLDKMPLGLKPVDPKSKG